MDANRGQIDPQTLSVLTRIKAAEGDPRECYAQLKQRMDELRQHGSVIPEELLIAERHLATELRAQSQGR